jgi:type II secretory pathway pseudopilin PulG
MLPNKMIRRLSRWSDTSGFSMIELLIVVACAMIVLAIAIPYYSSLTRAYNIKNDADKILAQLNLARMRASADFARAQLSCSNTTNTCMLQTKQYGTSGWTTESSQAVLLSQGVSFGTPPGISLGAGGQSGEAPYEGSAVQSVFYAVVLNSRGLPIVDNSAGSSVSDYAFYLLGPDNICMAVTVDVSGRASIYSLNGSTWQVTTN